MNRDTVQRIQMRIQRWATHIEWLKTRVEPDEEGFRPWAEVQAEEIAAAEAKIAALNEQLARGEQ